MELNHTYLAEYVRRAKNGDSDAFTELYSCTYNKVYNYCRHYLKDDYLAQDAVQEVYITALKNLIKLNDPTLFVAWLNRIAFTVCYDICKKRDVDYGDLDVDSEIMEDIKDTSGQYDPEGNALDSDEKVRLNAALKKLNPTLQHLVTLRYINNLKIDEIVSMTDLSRSTVKRHLQTAVEQLQQCMSE